MDTLHTQDQRTITEYYPETDLQTWLEAFLVDRRAQGLANGTIGFYRLKLEYFAEYCQAQVISQIPQITPTILRAYLLYLEERGNNPGGIHAFYRAVRTFLYWWEDEVEPDGWKNPIRKVKAPRTAVEPLKPISSEAVRQLLATCDDSLLGFRDKAIILCLLDTGVRASELCAMELVDLDRVYGSILIPKSKGNRPRTVFLGKKSRRALRAYLRRRKDSGSAIWMTKNNDPLTYWGLRQIIRRRAERSNIPVPRLHDFRRAFALACLRNGVDVYSLQRLMGHADLQVLRGYLAQTTDDIRQTHQLGSPVDHARL
jgi:site-specific recombinase XerD